MRHDQSRHSLRVSRGAAAAVSLAILSLGLFRAPAQAAQLAQNVLIVYNSANSDSIDVANYYAAKRGIPAANLCAITPPATTFLSWSAFISTVRNPVANCVNAIGYSNILYIVFSYQTPYKVIAPDNASYAVDQYVADLFDSYTPPGQYGVPPLPHPYYTEAQSQGNVYTPFQSFAAFRNQNAIPIFSVWRLDAATPALAKGLVDKALLAETSRLSGQVCIDEQFPTATYDYGSNGLIDWDLRQSATLARQAGFPVTQDFNVAEFGTSPASLRCDNAALYSGLYSYNHYNDAFSWNPGAIGFHLESASAIDPRGGTNWSANAIIKGLTVTSGVLAESTTQGLSHPDGIFRNLFEGANVGDAFMRNTRWLKWVTINIGDPLYLPFPGGIPAITTPQNSLALSPQQLIGGNPSTATITLASPAAGDITIALKSGQTTVATVPPSIIIPSGQTTASFPVNTNQVISDSPVFITATFGTNTLTNTLVVLALLNSVSVSPVAVIGGAPATGFVFLNDQAPAGGIVVGLSSNNAAASVPATVSVPAGAFSATFPITTTAVSLATPVTLSASYNGAKRTVNLTVNPLNLVSVALSPTSALGGVSTTFNKVILSGAAPSDTVVSLSSSDPGVGVPATVTVAAGATSSPYFTITTSAVAATSTVTISATYNGITKTANLTVNPIVPLSVTLSPASVVGGVSATLNRVTLNGPAPASGVTVNLASSDPGVGVPPTVTIAAGATSSPYFTITTSAVAAMNTVTISATYNGVTKTANLTVNPVALFSVALSPASVVGGVSATFNKVTLSGPAPASGITVNLTSSDAGVGVPATVTIPAGATSSPYFIITTSPIATTITVTISATYNGVMKTANLTVTPAALLSVALSPATVVGGVSATFNKVTLSGPAPASGVIVNLTSSDPGVGVPATVTVAAGATSSPYFTITTSPVAATSTVTISATYNGVTKTGNLTVNPVVLLSVALFPTSVVGGVSATSNKVTLSGPAPPSGAIVNMTSSDPGVGVPATVTVAAGATSSTYFTITTSAVTATSTVTISATYNGITKTANLTVTPVALLSVALFPTSVVGGVSATSNKVTLNGPAPPSGVIVNMTSSDPGVGVPATVTVAAGATSSAYFTITTSAVTATSTVIISATYNGVTKTANLTVTPVALLSVALFPTSVVGGASATSNNVMLSGPAPPSGAIVNMTSSDPGVGVPATVTVAAGTTSSPYFTITTLAVTTTSTVTISATYNGVTKTANLTVTPVALLSLALYPASVVGGVSATFNKVTLNGPAPASGVVVNMTSSDPGVGVPATVTVAAGATSSPYFTITTSAVAATKTVTISATYNGVTKTANLTVNP